MTAWRILILSLFLFAGVFCPAESPSSRSFTPAEYRAELDGLLASIQHLDSSATPTPTPLESLPQSWPVHTDQGDFEISTEGLRRDVRRYDKEKNVTNATAIRVRLEHLRREIDEFEKPPADVSGRRTDLGQILARPEFRDVRGPDWRDRLKQWVLQKIFGVLRRLFRSSFIPNVGRYFVYSLIGIAGLALLYLVYRSIFQNPEMEELVPRDVAVSAKEWTIWLAEARAAAERGDWREAVHLAYWAGISFLERQGFWRPDRARTPREYLRLISPDSGERETLAALTRIFELSWYAKREASQSTFSQTLEQLEKLGCR